MEYIEIPQELIALLSVFLTVIITQVLKSLGEMLNYPLEGFAAQVTASVVAAVLVFANAALSNVPVEFAAVANSVLRLVVVLLAAFGVYDNFVGKGSAKG